LKNIAVLLILLSYSYSLKEIIKLLLIIAAMQIINDTFYSGTSGLVLPVPKALYPAAFKDKSRLIYYASLFNSVEINSSFYKTPMASTVSKWADSVHGNFQFTFKLSKAITHSKELLFDRNDVDYFMQTIGHAGNKKGCLLAQFPPGVKIEKINQLKELVTAIKESDAIGEWKLAIEFRHRSWYHNNTMGDAVKNLMTLNSFISS
jgi:uncharacterized protein YecE (DUF72 family)